MSFFLILTVVILIFLNGATDASNAIASSVSSGALSMRQVSPGCCFSVKSGSR